MIEDKIKTSTPPASSENQNFIPSPAAQEDLPVSISKDTVITITLSTLKEHKITIEGIPDLNNDGIIDIKDVLIAIKHQIEKDESANT